MTTSTTTENFLGKCKEKGCDYVIFATAADVKTAENFKAVTAGTGVYKVGNNGHFARCVNRHKFFAVKRVKGTYSPDHQCDSRCLNAKGWECTCSCGGANHGRGHVATIVQAADIPAGNYGHNEPIQVGHGEVAPPLARARYGYRNEPSSADLVHERKVAKHLGEVGKIITGKVTVGSKRDLDASTLYAFVTVGNLDLIKWFAPSYANPDWPVGKVLTIRAKVKAHNEFRGIPETVVTYVEEVE